MTPPFISATLRHAARLGAGVALAASLAASLAVPHAFAQPAFDLPQLMQQLAQHPAGQARFTEQRYSSMLEQPLQSSGRLAFEAPDGFIRETLEPRREKLAVLGNQLTLTQGTRVRTLALDATPEAALMIEAIRGTLTGNRGALERHFNVALAGEARAWHLELKPRDARLLAQVRSIRVSGRDGVVREVEVNLADGDRSLMRIEPLPANASAAPASAVRP
jgi:outer membrane lipoprotein-sorting protein